MGAACRPVQTLLVLSYGFLSSLDYMKILMTRSRASELNHKLGCFALRSHESGASSTGVQPVTNLLNSLSPGGVGSPLRVGLGS